MSSAASDKLYIVTRNDLSSGYQTVQAAHVVADWCAQHPAQAATWRQTSNSLIVLSTQDEQSLYDLIKKAKAHGIGHTVFREPDLCDEVTSVAFTPSDATRKLLSNTPLAGRRYTQPGAEVLEREALAREKNLRELASKMENCEQTPGQDVLAHGRSVREHYNALRQHLQGELDLSKITNWRLPEWVDEYQDQLAASAGDRWLVDRYLTLHDCGKPAVLTIDADGRRHFPNHSKHSPLVYTQTYGEAPQHLEVAELIAHDMDIHLLKADGVPEFCENKNAVVHLLAGLAEVTSNAAMFGGIQSTSFKIKHKQLSARGKAICATLFGEAHE